MHVKTTSGFLLVVALSAMAGCKDDPNPCDSTSYHDKAGSCMPYMDAAAPPPASDAAAASDASVVATDTDTEANAGEAGGASKLGLPCTDSVTHGECQGADTDYCAIEPGGAGYCTKSNCVTNADCPTNWTCFDLSKMGITGYPAMCTKPRA
jgi:hypothetical protein